MTRWGLIAGTVLLIAFSQASALMLRGSLHAVASNPLAFTAPQLRLSLVTNSYLGGDVDQGSALYWTPRLSGGIGPVVCYNGTALVQQSVSQKSLTVSATSGKNYNVYYDCDTGTLTLGAQWTNDSTPSETLADEQGQPSLSTDHTKLLIGWVRACATNKLCDTPAQRFLDNAWNRLPQRAWKAIPDDGSAPSPHHTYDQTTVRCWNADCTNQFEFLLGEAQTVEVSVSSQFAPNSGNAGLVMACLDYAFATPHDYVCAQPNDRQINMPELDYDNEGTLDYSVIKMGTALTVPLPLGYHFYVLAESSYCGGGCTTRHYTVETHTQLLH